MRSIINNEEKCLICETPLYKRYKQTHNIFYGNGKEELSQKYGCWCYLCADHHLIGSVAVHFNKTLDKKLKAHAQKRFNEVYPDLDFVQIFGENYL